MALYWNSEYCNSYHWYCNKCITERSPIQFKGSHCSIYIFPFHICNFAWGEFVIFVNCANKLHRLIEFNWINFKSSILYITVNSFLKCFKTISYLPGSRQFIFFTVRRMNFYLQTFKLFLKCVRHCKLTCQDVQGYRAQNFSVRF